MARIYKGHNLKHFLYPIFALMKPFNRFHCHTFVYPITIMHLLHCNGFLNCLPCLLDKQGRNSNMVKILDKLMQLNVENACVNGMMWQRDFSEKIFLQKKTRLSSSKYSLRVLTFKLPWGTVSLVLLVARGRNKMGENEMEGE